MKIGYARISTSDQCLDMQMDALKLHGCNEIFTDVASGGHSARPGLTNAMNKLKYGHTLIVWKLDRLGRSMSHLVSTVNEIEKMGAYFKSLQENIDTTTSTGKLTFHIFSAMAEFERGLLIERTKAGLEAARARGRCGGRKKKLNDSQLIRLLEIYNQKSLSIDEICRIFKITRQTLYNYLEK